MVPGALPPLFGFIAAPTPLALLPGFLAAYIAALPLSTEALHRLL